MSKSDESSSNLLSSFVSIDMRFVGTHHALAAMRMYLRLMEEQMPKLKNTEIELLESKLASPASEESYEEVRNEVWYVDMLFDEDLIPTMRYSFIVFLHTVFETHLRAFCGYIRDERSIPISAGALKGSELDRANVYLSKLAGIKVAEFPEWGALKRFQRVRDCIVHHHGYVSSDYQEHKLILEEARTSGQFAISPHKRIEPTDTYCVQHLENIASLFRRLFAEVGYKE